MALLPLLLLLVLFYHRHSFPPPQSRSCGSLVMLMLLSISDLLVLHSPILLFLPTDMSAVSADTVLQPHQPLHPSEVSKSSSHRDSNLPRSSQPFDTANLRPSRFVSSSLSRVDLTSHHDGCESIADATRPTSNNVGSIANSDQSFDRYFRNRCRKSIKSGAASNATGSAAAAAMSTGGGQTERGGIRTITASMRSSSGSGSSRDSERAKSLRGRNGRQGGEESDNDINLQGLHVPAPAQTFEKTPIMMREVGRGTNEPKEDSLIQLLHHDRRSGRKLQERSSYMLSYNVISNLNVVAKSAQVLNFTHRTDHGDPTDRKAYAMVTSGRGSSPIVYFLEKNYDPIKAGTYKVVKATQKGKSGQFDFEELPGSWIGLAGLLLLDSSYLLLADYSNNSVRKVGLQSYYDEPEFSNLYGPLGLARHPMEGTLYVSGEGRIYAIPLDSTSSLTSKKVLAGPAGYSALDYSYDSEGIVDSWDPSVVRFDTPLINPRSVSADGSVLYLKDVDCIRRVKTATGATDTVLKESKNSSWGPLDGDPISERAAIYDLVDPVVTSNGCNMFVGDDSNSPRIRWIMLSAPGGNVIQVRTIVQFSNHTGVLSLTLSDHDSFLFVGFYYAVILKFDVDIFTLHQCGTVYRPYDRKVSRRVILASCMSIAVWVVLVLAAIGLFVVVRKHSGETSAPLAPPLRPSKTNPSQEQPAHRTLPLGAIPERASFAPPSSSMPMESGMSIRDATTTQLGMWSSSMAASGFTPGSGTDDRHDDGSNILESLPGLTRFALSELLAATANFGPNHLLAGKGGGFGDVYRGTVMVGQTPTDVAIKVMKEGLDKANTLRRRQFAAELQTLGQLRHMHLCKLEGFCLENNMCILVYPFISGGSLYDRLHGDAAYSAAGGGVQAPAATPGHATIPSLDLAERLSIAKQMATVLRYMHHEVDPPVLHRDIKSRNVMVQGSGNTLRVILIDFGLAKLGNAQQDQQQEGVQAAQVAPGRWRHGQQTVVSVAASGTPGYIAPEYLAKMKLTTKNDVYAFGVVLLELLTGRKAVWMPPHSVTPGVPEFLVIWSRKFPFHGGSSVTYSQLEPFFDARLKSTFKTTEEWNVAYYLSLLAIRCTNDCADDRPTMAEALAYIDQHCKGVQSFVFLSSQTG